MRPPKDKSEGGDGGHGQPRRVQSVALTTNGRVCVTFGPMDFHGPMLNLGSQPALISSNVPLLDSQGAQEGVGFIS